VGVGVAPPPPPPPPNTHTHTHTLVRTLTDPPSPPTHTHTHPHTRYTALGSLGEQITYPDVPDLSDAAVVARLHELMRCVRLEHLVEREGGFAKVAPWANILSLGEQQRLGMARLFYHQPKYALLDQCTDAVSVDVEEALYDEARRKGITIITISQRCAMNRACASTPPPSPPPSHPHPHPQV
jgi:ABC-type uncharacterized transport system fused permease/ATPase subunit